MKTLKEPDGIPETVDWQTGSHPDDEGGHSTTTLVVTRESHPEAVMPVQRSFLELLDISGNRSKFELCEQDMFIGRSRTCELHIPKKDVSREHARIFRLHGEYHIEDLNSTNRVLVNGIRIAKCILRHGDQIDIGRTRLFFIEETRFMAD